eukprot:14850372-Alexandrium_andersonii.AAC.1
MGGACRTVHREGVAMFACEQSVSLWVVGQLQQLGLGPGAFLASPVIQHHPAAECPARPKSPETHSIIPAEAGLLLPPAFRPTN